MQQRVRAMNEADKPAQLQQLDTAQDVEFLLIQIANAIQRFISERNALRTRVEYLERELTRMRQQTTLIHDGYKRLSTEFVTQLHFLDSEVGNLLREPPGSMDTPLGQQQFSHEATSKSPPAVDTPFMDRSDRLENPTRSQSF
jgi:hypothetical protein